MLFLIFVSWIYLVFGYCIGSLPAGFFLVKWIRKVDLRTAGSGNVGALNAFEVSGSGILGASVLAIDAAKGALAVAASKAIFGGSFILLSTAAIGAVLGHNYPIWLKGRGGRGLATAAGAMLIVGWVIAATWIALWLVIHLMFRHVHGANIGASLLMPIVIGLLPASLFQQGVPFPAPQAQWFVTASALSLLFLARHVGPAIEIWKSSARSAHTGS